MSDTDDQGAELPLDGAGAQLRRGREAAGMSRAQVAAITRIPERNIVALEEGDYARLPARTYAVAFARSFAKAVGLDQTAIAAAVRQELAAMEPDETTRGVPTFEPGDPARVPSARIAWLAALVALVVVIGGFAVWRSYYLPGGELPSILKDEAPAPANTAAPAAPAAPGGPVVFTAEAERVWVKAVDAGGNQVFQKELTLGETWTVPEGVGEVRLSTARPDALAITIGGRPVAKLSEVQQMVSDVPVSAAALLARAAAVPTATAAAPAPVAQGAPPPARIRPSQSAPRPAAPVAVPSETAAAAPATATPTPASAPAGTADR